jgi:hypothetical protein
LSQNLKIILVLNRYGTGTDKKIETIDEELKFFIPKKFLLSFQKYSKGWRSCMPVFRIRDVYRGSGVFPHPGSNNNKRRRGKIFVVLPLFCSHKFTKLEIILVLNRN